MTHPSRLGLQGHKEPTRLSRGFLLVLNQGRFLPAL